MSRPASEMTKVERVIEGLQIFQSLGVTWTWAEHDEIGAITNSELDLNQDQRARLNELGWFFDDEIEDWAIFT